MLTDYEIDDSYIGKTLTPEHGYLVDCKQVRPASHYISPYGYNGVWKTGYFQIRGSQDARDLICICPAQAPMSPGYVINRSIPYNGVLRILCVPVGSLWRMTLSDTALTKSELRERAEALTRKQFQEMAVAMQNIQRGAKSSARTADAMLQAARTR